ncbi:MAG TPA: hypothetical protein VGN44_09500 [Candidatus Angelobacter sp.]|jgi:hypothetical protein
MESTKARSIFSLIVFPLAGMTAALVTMSVPGVSAGMARMSGALLHALAFMNPYGSLVFGIAIAACLWMFLGLRSIGKTLIFILASSAAAWLAGLSGIYAAGNLALPKSPEDFFIGGYVGAFVVVSAALFLLSARPKIFRVLMQTALWAVAGGALAVLGQNSGAWFGHIRSYFIFMHLDQRKSNLFSAWPNSDLALILVWQTGVGLVIALALWTDKRRLANSEP